MIIPNGTIEFIKQNGSSGGIDANGYPVAATVTYGTPIPCQYSASNFSYQGKSEGEPYIRASYSILVEYLDATEKTERLRLKDRAGNTLDEYSVIQFEPLDAVCQTRIIV